MISILLNPPDWIKYREKVLGDVVSNAGVVNTEGVANRPSKHIFNQVEAITDIQLGSETETIFRIGYEDKEGRGELPLTVNSAYIIKLNGKLILNLPKSNLTTGCRVRITKGLGMLHKASSVLIQGVWDGGGYNIGEETQLLLGEGTLDFDLTFIFNGQKWLAFSKSGVSDSTTIHAKPASTVQDDDYIIVYTPNGETYKLELNELATYVANNIADATTTTRGVVTLADGEKLKTAEKGCYAVTASGLRTELKRFLGNDFFPINAIGDIHFVKSTDNNNPYYDSDKIVRVDILFVTNDKDLSTMTKVPDALVYNMNTGFSFKWDGLNWVQQSNTVENSVPWGRIYYNKYTKKQYFVHSPKHISELSSDINIEQIQTSLDQRYVQKSTKINGYELNTNITLKPSDIPEFTNTVKSIINESLNYWGNEPSVGSTRVVDGKLQFFNGSGWVTVYPATWGA